MYKVYTGEVWLEFNTYNELLNYLKKFEGKDWLGKYNTFFNDVAGNKNDTKVYYDPEHRFCPVGYTFRTKRIIDDCGANLYSKKLIYDVEKWKYNESMEAKRVAEMRGIAGKTYIWGMGYVDNDSIPEYRREPWPGIHKLSHYRAYRHIRTFNEIKHSYDEEHKNFIRGTRGKHLPTIWDEGMRDWRNNGWKEQGRNRHQWEHGVKVRAKHSDKGSTYIVRDYNKKCYDNFEESEIA